MPLHFPGPRPRLRTALASALIGALLAGCAVLGVGKQQELDRQLIRFRGTVSTAPPLEGNLVVVLVRKIDEEMGGDQIVGHYVIERSGGRFQFSVTEPGRYALVAFNDRDADLVYEAHEPVLVASAATSFEVARGDILDEFALLIEPAARVDPGDPIDILEFQSRSAQDQLAISLSQLESVGEVTDLSDPRFAAEVGPKGLWSPYDFVFDIGAGVFFLQPYDRGRIPVLFIHGISGFPAQFRDLIESMDQERFQAWVYLYPSGAKLENVATHLTQLQQKLESRYGFEDIVFVAHSMGGLVARAFLLDYYEQTNKDYSRKLITISTPWAGIASAALGARRMRNPVYSWIDVAPGSEFLNRIFFRDPEAATRQLLPPHMTAHLIFGFEGKGGGDPNDGTVTVASQLRPEAQREARTQFGVHATHTGILKDELTIDRLNSLLGSYADEL